MSGFADFILDGDCCQQCLAQFDEPGTGQARTCDACKAQAKRPPPPKAKPGRAAP